MIDRRVIPGGFFWVDIRQNLHETRVDVETRPLWPALACAGFEIAAITSVPVFQEDFRGSFADVFIGVLLQFLDVIQAENVCGD